MRHLKSFSPLNRTHSHRRALYRNMVEALFKNERIKTTRTKAKEISRVAEKLITKAKKKTLNNIRIAAKFIRSKAILMKLFDEISPRYINRKGGYTRVIKLARRMGDGAELAYLELIEEQIDNKKKKKKVKEKVKEESIEDVKEPIEEVSDKKNEDVQAPNENKEELNSNINDEKKIENENEKDNKEKK